jgi:hypothetical protein
MLTYGTQVWTQSCQHTTDALTINQQKRQRLPQRLTETVHFEREDPFELPREEREESRLHTVLVRDARPQPFR